MTLDSNSNAVRIVEVGPRDGLQNIRNLVPTSTKLALIHRLLKTGLKTIEITSVVSVRAVPQLKDFHAVLGDASIQALLHGSNAHFPVLIPNLKGFEIAKEYAVKEVAVIVSASEGFSRANIKCGVQDGLNRAGAVAGAARKHDILVRGYVSCVFHCPFDGPTPFSAVLNCVRQLQAMGCYEISLGDTIGAGIASDVVRLIGHLEQNGVSKTILAVHFHDTYGQAVANVWAAYQCGIRVFDTSVSGLGGCPYAPGAKGNVATEDVVYMFQQAGIETGVNLSELVDVGVWISQQLKLENSSRAGAALAFKKTQSITPSANKEDRLGPQDVSKTVRWVPHMAFDGLEILRSGTNLKIILNRPRNGNALTTTMITTLTEVFEGVANDTSITRIAITARGKYFCTGMDLAKGSTPVSQGAQASQAQYERLTRLFDSIDNSPQVTISCVQGPAFGGGVGLAFACDIRLMADTGCFTLSEVKLGLTPATISKYVIREWGPAFSREAILSARKVSAAELVRLGKVSQIVQTESDLSDALDLYLMHLKSSAPHASTMSKELVRIGCLGGGHDSEQEAGIKKLFMKMMSGNEEAAFGLTQFQTGNKAVDWDAHILAQVRSKAKL